MTHAHWTAEQSLLAAILTDPADDLPRLVYADWLEENAGMRPCRSCGGSGTTGGNGGEVGNPACPGCDGYGGLSDGRRERAEFIRVQCELAVLGKSTDIGAGGRNLDRYHVLWQRERKLWDDHAPVWFNKLGPAANRMPHTQGGCVLKVGLGERAELHARRGFVDSVTCSWAAWAGGVTEYTEGHPSTDISRVIRTPGLAAALLWADTVADPQCRDGDSGMVVVRNAQGWGTAIATCPRCAGSGHVPNPDPPPATAQPVTTVTITDATGMAGESFALHADGTARFDRWPGIAFRLPVGEPTAR